jgi:Flp pilus assembly pilin Flp
MDLTIITSKQSAVAVVIDDESGQGLVEYSLILAFIAVVAITAAALLGSDLSLAMSSIGNHL